MSITHAAVAGPLVELTDYQAAHTIANGTITGAQIVSGVVPPLGSATPLVESGSGAAGTATNSSHEDHVHPAASSGGTAKLPVQSKSFGSGGSNTNSLAVTLSSSPTNGNLLICGIDRDAAGTISTITQTGVTWTQLITSGVGAAPVAEIWKGVVGAGASATLTIACSTTTYTNALISEWNGITGTLDQSASFSHQTPAVGNRPYTPLLLPTLANALVIGVATMESNPPYGPIMGMQPFDASLNPGCTLVAGFAFPGTTAVRLVGVIAGTSGTTSGVIVSLT